MLFNISIFFFFFKFLKLKLYDAMRLRTKRITFNNSLGLKNGSVLGSVYNDSKFLHKMSKKKKNRTSAR
jgi:hypothetical protein